MKNIILMFLLLLTSCQTQEQAYSIIPKCEIGCLPAYPPFEHNTVKVCN